MAPVFQQGIARLKSCTASLTAIWCTPTFTNLQLLNHTHTFILQQHLICIGGLLKDAISANSDIKTKSLRTISLVSPVYLSHCFPISACFFFYRHKLCTVFTKLKMHQMFCMCVDGCLSTFSAIPCGMVQVKERTCEYQISYT